MSFALQDTHFIAPQPWPQQTRAQLKSVTAKMLLSLSISGHALVMESPKLDQRVKLFESFSSLNALTLWPSLGDSKAWPEIERHCDIFAVTPFSVDLMRFFGWSTAKTANKYLDNSKPQLLKMSCLVAQSGTSELPSELFDSEDGSFYRRYHWIPYVKTQTGPNTLLT